MRQALGAAVIAAMTAGAEGFAPAQLMPFGAGGGVLCAMRQPPALALRAPFRTGPTLHAKVRANDARAHAPRPGPAGRVTHSACLCTVAEEEGLEEEGRRGERI
jgi:hypothetical protein